MTADERRRAHARAGFIGLHLRGGDRGTQRLATRAAHTYGTVLAMVFESNEAAGQVRVRRLARRRAPGPSFSLSDEPVWRGTQRRFIAAGLFFVMMVTWLLWRKVADVVSTTTWVVAVATVGIVGAVLFWGLAKRKRRPKHLDELDREEALSAAAVEQQLLLGHLSPLDLVFEGGRWGTLLESAQFGDAASRSEAKLARGRRIKMALLVSIGLVAAMGGLVLLLSADRVFNWLVFDR